MEVKDTVIPKGIFLPSSYIQEGAVELDFLRLFFCSLKKQHHCPFKAMMLYLKLILPECQQ